MDRKTILITGCSSGIGRVSAKYFREQGWNVIATVRSDAASDTELIALDNVLVTELDVTQKATIEAAVKAGIARFGRIDAVLNNAGYGSYGLLEATPEHKIRMQFDVNVIGPLLVTQAVLPHFRSNRAGTILNISSMGGKISFPLGTLYHGSKFAVEGMTEALSFEMSAIGVRVKLIEPGVINTNFATTSFDLNLDENLIEYKDFTGKVLAGMQNTGSKPSEPIDVAKVIFQAATDDSDQMRYPVGEDAKQLISARKQMDDPEYLAMLRSQMGL